MTNIFSNFPYGLSTFEKLKMASARLFGCNHPASRVLDIGDEDTGRIDFCFTCGRYLNDKKN
jgi:hypothetical protein